MTMIAVDYTYLLSNCHSSACTSCNKSIHSRICRPTGSCSIFCRVAFSAMYPVVSPSVAMLSTN